jgi:hypothetical protein
MHANISTTAMASNKQKIDTGIRMKLNEPGTPSRNANRDHIPSAKIIGHQSHLSHGLGGGRGLPVVVAEMVIATSF